ncbi:type VII secretion target [Rhodococcoides kyotonense]|uniref:Excreted virulence factor EspC, type VII ESX diderm n=1 Tax=Rhodococcoides kyotonense TaxID=398843 RepID=A0A239MVJ7_9NOCA|nr:hypothetical protein [Rhodococcus kyotonensis]SNT45988.1 Excreted virulence factor EspC, type VII ESX diderm [Rhodococcus kyotonensis]
MAEISAVAAEIQAYAASAGALATEVAGAAAAATAAGPAVLTPVFGLIGTEFLGAAVGVHTAHTAAIARLADALGSIGVATARSGAGYELTDSATAETLA